MNHVPDDARLAMEVIRDALLKGGRFPYSLLRAEFEQVQNFWRKWWEGRDLSVISRPYTIADDDPILTHTIGKETVDSFSDRESFWTFLKTPLSEGHLPVGLDLSRNQYRAAIVDLFVDWLPQSTDPVVYFVGGGYGAGKTTIMHKLAKSGSIECPVKALVGVDACKMMLPEFERVKMISDGRASEITQEESRLIADELFSEALSQRRTFSWDSSMSNREETLRKIHAARRGGHRVEVISVYTPPQTALERAMKRAHETRRFPNPNHFHRSHGHFAKFFPDYVDEADKVLLFFNGNSGEFSESLKPPFLIALKDGVDAPLRVSQDRIVQDFLEQGNEK